MDGQTLYIHDKSKSATQIVEISVNLIAIDHAKDTLFSTASLKAQIVEYSEIYVPVHQQNIFKEVIPTSKSSLQTFGSRELGSSRHSDDEIIKYI